MSQKQPSPFSCETQEGYYDLSTCQEKYYDLSACQPTPSQYIYWEGQKEEASDEEIISYAAQSQAFAFLAEPEEDIYNCDDGQPL
jgi:hypothetical protein